MDPAILLQIIHDQQIRINQLAAQIEAARKEAAELRKDLEEKSRSVVVPACDMPFLP